MKAAYLPIGPLRPQHIHPCDGCFAGSHAPASVGGRLLYELLKSLINLKCIPCDSIGAELLFVAKGSLLRFPC